MSTATLVPETRGLSGEDAWTTLRRVGRRRLIVNAFQRLRVADGFSHARSMAYMTSLVAVQGVIAAVGLAVATGGSGFSDVVVSTLKTIVPGPAGGVLATAVAQANASGAGHRYPAIMFGVIGSLVTATTAFGQVERGLNRIYGVEQDRPSVAKYTRAFLLAITAGSLTAVAFVLVALGRDVVHGAAWNVARWPFGLVLALLAIALLLHTCPRRRQPHLSWLAFGAAVATALWVLVTAGLGLFFHMSRSFGQTYGPLAGIVALLLWAVFNAVSLFYGAAIAAQLEAERLGDARPQDRHKVEESEPTSARDPIVVAAR